MVVSASSFRRPPCRSPVLHERTLPLDLWQETRPVVVACRLVGHGQRLLHVELPIEHIQSILTAVLWKSLRTEPGSERNYIDWPEVTADIRDNELTRAESSFPAFDGEERHVPEC